MTVKKKVFYVFVIVWLILVPTFKGNMSHYDWGTIPFVISIFLIPGFVLYLFFDIINNIIEIIAENENTKTNRFMTVRIVVPLILLMACIWSVYYNFSR